jgi:hypothetical protein
MALQPFDAESTNAAAESVLAGIRADADKSRFNATGPKEVRRVSADEQREQREAIEERQAEALAKLEAQQAEVAESAIDTDVQFSEALAGAVAAKASEVALAEPNRLTATRSEVLRWEARVQADEAAKIAAEAKPAEVDDDLGNYFADLGEGDEPANAGDPLGFDDPEEVEDVELEWDSTPWDAVEVE